VNKVQVPVLVLTAQASYHTQYDWCSAESLTQTDLHTAHIKLKDRGKCRDGQMMFKEKKNDGIVGAIAEWTAMTMS
jgi:hypothetical protein